MCNRDLFTELRSALDEAKQHSEEKLPLKQSEMTSDEVGDSFEEGMSFHLVVTR